MSNGSLDWSKATFSNNKQYTDYACSGNATFGSQNMVGVDDYKDGISIKNLKTYPTEDSKKFYLDKKMNCQELNKKSGNIGIYGCLPDVSLRSVEPYEIFRTKPTLCIDPPITTTVIKPENPVYAYQFRYNINFTQANKTEQSNLYRNLTGLDGTYEGVNMIYTYYTYKKDGQYLPWENPNKDNANGGWLVYGSQVTPELTCDSTTSTSCGGTTNISFNEISLGQSAITADKMRMAKLGYNPNTKLLKWTLDLAATNGCDSVEKSYAITDQTGKLFINIQKRPIPTDTMCTMVYREYVYEASETSSIDPKIITNAITNKNFEVLIK